MKALLVIEDYGYGVVKLENGSRYVFDEIDGKKVIANWDKEEVLKVSEVIQDEDGNPTIVVLED